MSHGWRRYYRLPCPYCNAAVGRACYYLSGDHVRYIQPHMDRRRAVDEHELHEWRDPLGSTGEKQMDNDNVVIPEGQDEQQVIETKARLDLMFRINYNLIEAAYAAVFQTRAADPAFTASTQAQAEHASSVSTALLALACKIAVDTGIPHPVVETTLRECRAWAERSSPRFS